MGVKGRGNPGGPGQKKKWGVPGHGKKRGGGGGDKNRGLKATGKRGGEGKRGSFWPWPGGLQKFWGDKTAVKKRNVFYRLKI